MTNMGVRNAMCSFAWQMKTGAVGPSSQRREPAGLMSGHGRPDMS